MNSVYTIATNIVSSLGLDTAAHWRAVSSGKIGLRQYDDAAWSPTAFWASRLGPDHWQAIHAQTPTTTTLTPFEQLSLYSARHAMIAADIDAVAGDTAFILSTTKGNIELLGQIDDEALLLTASARVIAQELGINTKPFVVSHACVSGVVALQYGARLIESGRYKNVIITGCDRFSKFVLNGFQSFQAIADEPCRPFDAARKGINLGEAASTIILSSGAGAEPMARFMSGATTNDANHISGPSRTGDELAKAIERALLQANISASEVGILSAHGTATLYNDEMESKAFDTAGLTQVPVHSLKGYVGHTLGAAGVLESAMLIESLLHQQLIPSAGFANIGVPKELNVTTAAIPATINYALKTASGFGGCNAVAIFKKI
jgi:3-oxoacyl-[acyl-carrier-protein] synthase-1